TRGQRIRKKRFPMNDDTLENCSRIYDRFVLHLHDVEMRGDADSLLCYIQMAAKFAWLMPTGRYADGHLENRALKIGQTTNDFFNERASSFSLNLPMGETRRKVLHVATSVHNVGGHTKLIANWINRDPDSCHCLLITGGSSSQREDGIPVWLREAV